MGQIKRAYDEVASAKRPVIYAGGGVIHSNAARSSASSRDHEVPGDHHPHGPRRLPCSHELWLGMLGMHGTFRAIWRWRTRISSSPSAPGSTTGVTGKIAEFAPEAKIIHVDIDPTSISKNVLVDIPSWATARMPSKSSSTWPKSTPSRAWSLPEALAGPDREVAANYPLAYEQGPDVIKPQFVVEKIYELSKGKAIITTEVGQNQMWTAQYYHLPSREPSLPRAVWGPWATASPRPSAPRRPFPIGWSSMSPATAASKCASRNSSSPWRTTPGEGCHSQQPVPGNGAAVAAALLRSPVLPDLPQRRS